MYDKFQKLLDERGVTSYRVHKETGISTATLSDWKNGKSQPKKDKIEKICAFFNVPLSYFYGTGTEPAEKPSPDLTARDERDIAKDIDSIMTKLMTGEDGPASYDGMELDPEAAELFRDELEIALRRLKIINKEKYRPDKYKK